MVADRPVDPLPGGSTPTPEHPESDAVLARRAQILATEHWGLLAARGTAQSEVLTRITIYLTLVSAGLVTIGLLGQATRFEGWFTGAALAILGFLSLVGLMTQTRVGNVAEEDLMYVVAMNRLRGAYVDLDPVVEQYFLASIADDMAGSRRTYSFIRRRGLSHIVGSSVVLIVLVNACVFGLFTGALASALGIAVGGAIAIAVIAGLVVVGAFLAYAEWTYRETWHAYEPRRRTTDAASPGAASRRGRGRHR
jgi:membrane protein YdbS with pleckstrin-like domain